MTDSPAQRLFGPPPAGSSKLAAFGWAAARHQPLDYADAVLDDTVKYLGFGVDDSDLATTDLQIYPGDHWRVMPWINHLYEDEVLHEAAGLGVLEDTQAVLRVHPWLLLIATLAAIAAVVLAAGRLRAVAALLLGAGILLLLTPSATAVYGFRYALPANGPLIAAGAIGVWLIAVRLRDRDARQRGEDAAAGVQVS